MSGSQGRSLSRRILKWVAIVMAVIFVLSLPVFPQPQPWGGRGGVPVLEFFELMIFGWIHYLARTLPHVAFNKEIALDAGITLALAIFGLHRVLMWWTRQRSPEKAEWRLGWTLKITAMILMLFATSIAATGILHQAGWLLHDDKLIVNGALGSHARDLYNLREVGLGLQLFAADHDERFPAELKELVPDYLPSRKLLFTPSYQDELPQPVLYYRGYTTADPPDVILLASPRSRSLQRSSGEITRTVAYLNNTAGTLKESEYQEAIQKQETVRKAKPSGTVPAASPPAP